MVSKNIDNTLTSICRYYMEFLESDFKRNRLPSRKIDLTSKNEMLKTYELSRYERLNKVFLNKLADGFKNNNVTIKKQEHVKSLKTKAVQSVVAKIKAKMNDDDLGGEKDLQDILLQTTSLRADQVAAIAKELIGKIENAESYLLNKKLHDCYEDLFDLWKSKQILDKEEIYLYMYDVTFQDNTYPLFYIQADVELKDDQSFIIEFSSVLTINKKALQYISETYAKSINKSWRLEIPSRQLYFGNYSSKDEYLKDLSKFINEVTNFFSLRQINLTDTRDTIRYNDNIAISNNCYFALFDKSDEAILNDYEELLNMLLSDQESSILDVLNKLGQDYLFGDPQSFSDKIEREYEAQETSDKLVFKSPIPLNKEQVQVLNAINKPGCSRIIIHGPPGTGKSHTITAVIYDALLKNKSILVVSDKKEALDVVEDKIEQVLSKMKIDDFIQNPLLRLGRKENNFNKIFKQSNYDKIKSRYYAYMKEKERIEKEIVDTGESIRSVITESIEFQEKFTQDTINWLILYEEIYDKNWSSNIDIKELQGNALKHFKAFAKQINIINKLANEKLYTSKLNIKGYQKNNLSLIEKLNECIKCIQKIKELDKNNELNYLFLEDINESNMELLESVMLEFRESKAPLVGHLFSNKIISRLEYTLKNEFPNHHSFNLKKHHQLIEKELFIYKSIRNINKEMIDVKLNGYEILREQSYDYIIEHINQLIDEIKKLDAIKDIPKTLGKINYSPQIAESIFTNKYAIANENEVQDLLKYLSIKSQIAEHIQTKADDFIDQRSELERNLILKMTNILDESVIYLRENHRNAVEDLRRMIRQKRKIGTEYLEKLIKAFPCLIVNIRELGDYIPLEVDLFDLVIIDEASQVSIAQAFPAIMRGQKVLVLGDDRQFSNVKSHNASININNFYMNKVRLAFQEDLNSSDEKYDDFLKDKINSFNIKNSILSFIKSVVNYECSLKKHFRSYMEIIGYSNDTFYDHSLQVMKIRGKSITSVIRFMKVEVGEREEIYKNTNTAEIECIVNELELLDKQGFTGTVGIITPFTNQQKLISNMLFQYGKWEHYTRKFSLKVMTFDSCQGDEKDIIYYSMVERDDEDILKYIFPVSFNSIDLEEEGNLKAQRLNVGFSRAKEQIVIVTSKDVENFRGEIGNALRKYRDNLNQVDYISAMKRTDPSSPVERKILNYIYQTELYKENPDHVEVIPQFGIGKYINQIDPYATIPDYRVDFLLIYKFDDGTEKVIVIEYDGFEYHFDQNKSNSKFISERNLIEADIERQKTIELYGYPFIRFNKFNLTEEPIKEIDRRLKAVIFKKKQDNQTLEFLSKSYEKIAKREERICDSCNKIKPLNEYRDSALATGLGRICAQCKKAVRQKKDIEKTKKKCSYCGVIKPMDEFYDEELSSMYGRICNKCKANKNQKEETHRVCSQCGKTQPLLAFRRKRTTSGYGRICSTCIKKCPRCGTFLRKMYNAFGGYYGCSKSSCGGQRSYID